jgi:exopolyphosphatase/guanosine-5'-triphosphate,3'-diphosphate pyrophosphatase
VRVATVDIGTNTVLLLVAQRAPSGDLTALVERATITRLGQGVDRSRRFAPEALERTRACLEEYGRVLRELGVDRIAVVGTSAMRDAAGGELLRACVRESFGVDAAVVSGAEEARLTFRGALSGLTLPAEAVAVFDIGGGSTEVVVGRAPPPAIDFASSFDIGSVRLTERIVAHDPPSTEETVALERAAGSAFRDVPELSGQLPVGVAGTMTTLAAVQLRLAAYDGARVHGHTMTRSELRRVVSELAALPLEARRSIAGMEPKRADVIVAGGFIALALLEHWRSDAVVVSDRGVRWGLAEELSGAGAGYP